MSENTGVLKKKNTRPLVFSGTVGTISYQSAEVLPLNFDYSEFHPDALKFYTQYGIRQFLNDKLARSKDEKLTDAEARELQAEYIELSKKGLPSKPRTTGPREPSIAISDIESKFINAVKSGVMGLEQAKTMFTAVTNKPWMLDDSVFNDEPSEVTEEEEIA